MKKIFSIVILILYITGSSYFVHASMMGFPVFGVDMVGASMECNNSQTSNNLNKNCLELCIGKYDKVNVVHMWDFKRINKVSFNFNYVVDVLSYNQGQGIHYVFVDDRVVLPDKIFPYKGYVGKITVLLI